MFRNKTPKILMVEDNRNNHPLFTDVFEAAGFEVVIAQNAEEGFVDFVVDVDPDIISMDIMIGKSGADLKVGGLDALGFLKDDERTKNIPVMMLSNFSNEDKVNKAKALGAVDFISLQVFDIKKIPDFFKRYLKSPKNYGPNHPIFRE